MTQYRFGVRRPLRAAALTGTLAIGIAAGLHPARAQAPGQLNENCVVSVLNRSVRVSPDGTWVLPNIPANFGRVRARATCVNNGITVSGESDYFTVPATSSVDVPPITLGNTTPIPTSMTITAPTTHLGSAGQTVQLTVTATYGGGPPADVTAAGSGTSYTISNTQIATISDEGAVSAVRSGRVLVQAINEGTQGLLSIQVAFGNNTDTDNDGIPDDEEIRLGLNPNEATDAIVDLDRDGLTNREEFELGTDLRDADTDGDDLMDGEEVSGARGFLTNPLLADTDADGITDLTEILTGSDPTNPASYNLAGALTGIAVQPGVFHLIVNSISGIASVQLSVVGNLIDNRTINLTSTLRGTNYSSSDLNVCNFGSPDGRVYASAAGSCTITVTNSGFTTTAAGSVALFTPAAVSFVTIPGFANAVALSGDTAFVAAGASGLQVVALDQNRTSPQIVASRALPGNANGVVISGDLAYVAAGSAGLHVIDISNPLTPTLLGSFSTGGTAFGVRVRGQIAYVSSGSELRIVNVANPAAMILVSAVQVGGTAWNLDLDPMRNLVAVAAGSAGVRFVDVTNPSTPVTRGSIGTGDARGVALKGNIAFVADRTNSMRSVSIVNPAAPVLLSTTPANLGGFLNDIVLSGDFALGADVLFVNGVPIVDISNPAVLQPRAILNFPARDDNGMGVAVDASFVYLAADLSNLNRGGSTGNSRLYIGQFRPHEDLAGVPPAVTITAPVTGQTMIEGERLTVTVDAVDDVAVVGVNFVVDGNVAFTDTSSPYEYTFTVPGGINTLTLGARATDLGGNVGVAEDVVLAIQPDPLTLVTGLVVDEIGTALVGATVSAPGGRTGITGPSGRFDIPGVPTIFGPISIAASYTTPGGDLLTGNSGSFAAVQGGVTDVGTTTMISVGFETNFGTYLSNVDDTSYLRALPFTFPFYGVDYSSTFVGTNGYFTFGGGDSTYVESLPSFQTRPRISAFFDDLYGARSGGAVYVNDQLPGRFVVTHDRVGHFSYGGSNTIQIQLFSDGRIVFAFNGITSTFSGSITGLTPGPNSPAQAIDFSAQRDVEIPAGTAVYEYFTSNSLFDLDYGFVTFTPTPAGGYRVRTILPSVPPLVSLLTAGPAQPSGGSQLVAPPPGSVTAQALALAEVFVTSSSDPSYIGMTNIDSQGRLSLQGVPAGGINVVIRRNGRVIARGTGIFPGGELHEARVLDLVLALPLTSTKTEPEPGDGSP